MNYNFDPEAKDDEETKKPLKEQSATKKKMHGRIFKLKRSVSKLSQLSKEDDESDEDSEESEEEEAEEEKKKVDNKSEFYDFRILRFGVIVISSSMESIL